MLKIFGDKKGKEKKGKNNNNVNEKRPASAQSSNGTETDDHHRKYVETLNNFIIATEKLGIEGLAKQYRKLDAQQDSSLTFEAFKQNMHKNRYSDVVCRDTTRVKLTIDKSRYEDYIHANYVKTNYLRNTFICTQGPLQHTIIDFWRMIFQERAESILMLCKTMEEGRPKCVGYWPSLGVTETYGCIRVTNMGESSDEFEICNLAVTFVPDNVPVDEQPANLKELRVNLIKWPNWPDRGVPDEKCHTVPQRLLAQVRHGPCVVHCSAGIGRTGCVVALEFAYNKLDRGLKVDFEEIITELRKQRAQCIQTEIQYLYIHRVMIAFARGETDVSEKALAAADAFLKSYDEHLKKI
ncbi:Protein-tyrosine phosphatase [Caenorhabditis elegans]|uniref:Protein-tyrosine phosphatase n=1 Tax=Caenorhabditis elegans TaxID=6239 RepID=H2KZ95_CAEEL|nr:Protein-tyrosine phosphatase [Caenorhabditis elegans]CCD67071.1 Protein-tyrosine phosphatase [Caenorhabditis elegans]|eukprot:NP_001022892.1 Tyrosine-protein phosphatase [Caenorhabditis elegans]